MKTRMGVLLLAAGLCLFLGQGVNVQAQVVETTSVVSSGTANPVPFVNNPLVPASAIPGGPGFTLTVNGTGFVSGATVNWNGTALITTFVSSSVLTATVPASNTALAGTATITVTNPALGGGNSEVVFFPIANSKASVGFVQSSIVTGLVSWDIAARDFNGDGKVDLATMGAGPNFFEMYLSAQMGNGDGTFGPPLQPANTDARLDLGMEGTVPLVVPGDFNGDGKIDALVDSDFCDSRYTVTYRNCVQVLLAYGDGRFASPVPSPVAFPDWGAIENTIATGDFNRDGKLDIAVAGSNLEILLGNGDGTFQTPLVSAASPGEFTVGDFNGDGKLDLAVSANDLVSIYNGVGDGTFQAGNSYPASPSGPVTAADLNGDGKLDLVLFNGKTMLGNGDGTFQTAVAYAYPALSGRATVVDLNGDGKLDLAVNSINSIEILLGNGNGTFQTANSIPTPTFPLNWGSAPGHLVAADFNGDGRLDLAAVSADQSDPSNTPVILFIQPPPLALLPTTLSWGAQVRGTTSAVQAVTLSNTEMTAVAVSSIGVTGTNSGDFALTTDCGASLAAGAHCTISVTFTPTAVGSRSANLTVTDNAAGSPHTVSLTGTGTAPAASLSATTLSFGNQMQGTTSSSLPLTLTNTGSAALSISSFGTTADFAQTNNCGSSVAVSAHCTINVTFTPTAVGSRSGTLSITDNAPGSPHTISLSGTGTPPLPDLTISLSHSGTFTQGQAGTTYTLSVSNIGPLASSGTVAVTDSLPTGLTATALSGVGWACTVATTTCTRSDVLSAGASYPPIVLSVNVGADAAANLINTATVSGGGETNTANNTATDPTHIMQPPTADAVTPTPASGLNQTFSATYSTHNGKPFTDLNYVRMLINPRVIGAQGCYVLYSPHTNFLFLENDTGTGTSAPMVPGSAGTLANSQCTVNGATTTVVGSGSTLRLNLSVSAASTFMGSKNIYLLAEDSEALSSGWQNRGSWTPMGPDTAPTADAVTPAAASGPDQTFSVTYSSRNGKPYTDLTWARVLFNPMVSGTKGCYVLYYVPDNKLYLQNDSGTGSSGPLTPGAPGTLANSQCTVNGAGTSVAGSGSSLRLNLSVSASTSFVGTWDTYLLAENSAGMSSGWQERGTWTTFTPPTADSATPAAASGPNQTFSLAYSSQNGKGYADLATVRALINPRAIAAQGCYVLYNLRTNFLFLENDTGTGTSAPLTPGAPGTLANSQCTVNGAGTTVSGTGPTLRLNLSVSAAAGFMGSKNIYLQAENTAGLSSGWQSRGTWTPMGPDTAPTADAVTPTPASGPDQIFNLTYSSQNGKGYADLTWVRALINWGQSGTKGCYVLYYVPTNKLYLENDAGTGSSGPLTPGAVGTLANSQCTLTGYRTTVSGSGSTLTMNLALSASTKFVGSKNIYLLAENSGGLSSGWQSRGTWTTFTPPTADAVTPAAASGPNQTFSLTYSALNGKGYTELTRVRVMINPVMTGARGCYVIYNLRTNYLFLENDAGTGTSAPLTPGAAGTLANSQCTVNGAATTVSGSGPTLTLNLSVSAAAGFGGSKNIYLQAENNAGLSSGWQNRGIWIP